ncbi:olfactory receptor 1019-like isoform X2 [Bombina bombina]|uniref:olfactory receptor 1019-like isoform X2 n=1 Tax=Bombina bombina TaxID=8345 RepID=UPI00235AB9DD|nr:olfactory receptor 1019-like isoform X2 [Bombina bombina]
MEQSNHSHVSEFILMGLSNEPTLELLMFIFFLLIYLVTICGNIGIILTISIISDLHNPMYFFLSNLSFSDLCYSTVVTPRMLHDIFSQRKSISFISCAVQLYFFATFATIEGYILSTMAYDRYVAICYPLLYPVIMNRRVCILLVCVVYFSGLLTAGIHTSSTLTLSFCGPNVINHFFCDIPPLMELSCSDTYTNKTIIFCIVCLLGLFSGIVTVASYTYIFATIMKIKSSTGKRKAFSTCTSHLLCVSLFYGTAFFMYLRPASSYSASQDKVVSVFYSMVIPMINPIIYSLRNTEVKKAVTRYIHTLVLRLNI